MKFNFAYTPLVLLTLLGTVFIIIRFQLMGWSMDQFASIDQLSKLKSHLTFAFLLWNIFLAWLPLFFSLALSKAVQKGKPLLLSFSLLMCWLLFLPNAPYILTDLLHLKWRHPIPHWYDLMILVIFAWTGWQLGIASLIEVYKSVKNVLGMRWASITVALSIALCAPGIYLGRVLRYNSWDIIHQPMAIIEDLFMATFAPLQMPGAGMIWMLIPFLGLTFWSQLNTQALK